MTTRAVFLWHMHQPDYRDPETGRPLLPWVRLHSTRAYTDMAAMLERYPQVRAVVNWAPCLLLQLDDYVSGRSRDRDEELAAREATTLSPGERAQVLSQSFSVDWELWVKTVPRYAELLAKRGTEMKKLDIMKVQEQFTAQDLNDVQVHFALAWMGFTVRKESPLVRELLAKERGFTEEEKRSVLAMQREIAGRVLGRYRTLRERGQIEITCSPLFHPILPLLVDSDSARRAMPHAELPPRFSYPQDAQLQVTRGLDVSEKSFGDRPVGMWPSEGSVSPEVIELLANSGLNWCATDQGILERSELASASDSRGGLHARPWMAGPENKFTMLFRDRDLSDAVGFRYARATAEDGASDLVGKLSARAGDDPLVTIALDGENAWEHYAQSGELFLSALYEQLSKEPRIATVLPREELLKSPARDRIVRLHSGSWIESNYRIWISHPEDNSGWRQLGLARAAVASAEAEARLPRAQLDAARDALLPAEGSDWFWWYGDDFQTDNAAEFDSLFRRHVAAGWRALGLVPPEELGRPIISPDKDASAALDLLELPRRLIEPSIDGDARGYFEWSGAGIFRPGRSLGGSMHQTSSGTAALWFGFGQGQPAPNQQPGPLQLFLRLDPIEGSSPQSALRIHLTRARKSAEPVPGWTPVEGKNEEARALDFRIVASGKDEPIRDASGAACGHGRSGAIVEMAVQISSLGLLPQDRFGLLVRGMRGEVELERLPRYGEISLVVPGRGFEAAHWTV